MQLEQVLGILDDMTARGKTDAAIVALAHRHGEQCFAIANGSDPVHNQPALSICAARR